MTRNQCNDFKTIFDEKHLAKSNGVLVQSTAGLCKIGHNIVILALGFESTDI
jgi:hypothetical protein